MLRAALDADAAGIIAVVERSFQDYPGCVLDVDREEPRLLTPATSHDAFWVLVERGRVAGTCAAMLHADHEPPHLELKTVYLDHHLRGRGLGRKLVECAERLALESGLGRVELWSDSRFEDGHRAYAAMGYAASGATRELHDLSATVELHFAKELDVASRQ